MADFQPPPTYALPILVEEETGKATFNPVWLKWFVDLAAVISAGGGGSGSLVHNDLSGLQGGTSNQFYHMTFAEDALVAALGTISSQNANNVAITGGTINGTTAGATTPAAGTFTTLLATVLFRPPTDAGAAQTATAIFGGSGAPNNANGSNGDFYFRSDGGALTSIYHKRAGAWVGIV